MTKIVQRGSVKYYMDLEQNTDEWLEARRGLLTGSVMKVLLTGKFEISKAAGVDTLMYQLLAERITGRLDDNFQSWDMIRGHIEEVEARDLYAATYAPVQQCGFVTNDEWGFTIGYSPDGLVRGGGFIESKSRKQKLQVRSIIEAVTQGDVDDEFKVQVQTGMLVMKRDWCDHISYSNGMPMAVVKIEKDEAIQAAILKAAEAFEKRATKAREVYDEAIADADLRLVPTEWKEYTRPGDDDIEAPEEE